MLSLRNAIHWSLAYLTCNRAESRNFHRRQCLCTKHASHLLFWRFVCCFAVPYLLICRAVVFVLDGAVLAAVLLGCVFCCRGAGRCYFDGVFCLLPLFAFMKIYHGSELSIWRAPCTVIFAADWVSRLEGTLRLRAIDTSACTYDNI